MASKAASKSSSKSSSSSSKSGTSNSNSSKNIAAGGQVYDRTTGTWEGATQGSFGDGKDRGAGLETKIWRDADGIVGVQVLSDASKPQSTTSGPGNAGAANGPVQTTGPGAIGAAVGGKLGTAGPGNVSGGLAALPQGKLKEVMKPDVTSLKLGGNWWHANPWWSDADEWEGRYAEPGEWLGGVAVLLADTAYNTWRLGNEGIGPAIGTGVYRAEQGIGTWITERQSAVTAPIPKQEPVNWGQ